MTDVQAPRTFTRPQPVREYDDIVAERPRVKRTGKVQSIMIDHIEGNPFQPRETIDPEKLQPLISSMQRYGFTGHLEVRHNPADPQGRFQLVYGHRRLAAARQAFASQQVPCEIVEYSDQEMMEIALLENTSHEALTPWEEAQHVQMLMRVMNLSVRGVQKMLGKRSKSWVENRLALLQLPEELREMARRNELDMTAALALYRLIRQGASQDDVQVLVDRLTAGRLTADDLSTLQRVYKPEELDEQGNRIVMVTLADQLERHIERDRALLGVPDSRRMAENFRVENGELVHRPVKTQKIARAWPQTLRPAEEVFVDEFPIDQPERGLASAVRQQEAMERPVEAVLTPPRVVHSPWYERAAEPADDQDAALTLSMADLFDTWAGNLERTLERIDFAKVGENEIDRLRAARTRLMDVVGAIP